MTDTCDYYKVFYTNMMNNIPCIYFELDQDGIIQKCSCSASALFGKDESEFVGTPLSQYFTDEIDEEFFAEHALSVPNCGACLSNMAITPGGNVVPCQSWLSSDALGNFLSDDWDTIWNSDTCKKRRDYSALLLGRCPLRREK